ncbi:MAG: hypothetical protein OEN20_11930 [Gammaproteobacteria bacterium]|nr:hypothetical protein [Gammaproteobacteria bacterium]
MAAAHHPLKSFVLRIVSRVVDRHGAQILLGHDDNTGKSFVDVTFNAVDTQ